jgi:hypothetical protein
MVHLKTPFTTWCAMTYSFSDNIVGFHCNVFYKGICENKVAGSSDSQLLHASDIEEIVCLWNIRIMIRLKNVLNEAKMFWFMYSKYYIPHIGES